MPYLRTFLFSLRKYNSQNSYHDQHLKCLHRISEHLLIPGFHNKVEADTHHLKYMIHRVRPTVMTTIQHQIRRCVGSDRTHCIHHQSIYPDLNHPPSQKQALPLAIWPKSHVRLQILILNHGLCAGTYHCVAGRENQGLTQSSELKADQVTRRLTISKPWRILTV